jgi:hypothetical protein
MAPKRTLTELEDETRESAALNIVITTRIAGGAMRMPMRAKNRRRRVVSISVLERIAWN